MRTSKILSCAIVIFYVCNIVESWSISPRSLNHSRFTSIFAFGDSYTDNGSFNDFYMSKTDKIDRSSLKIDTSRTIKRESDGPLWVEYLAGLMDNADLYDFARSGATANNQLILRNTEDVDTQVNRYIRSDASKENKDNSLFTIWIGVNDMTVLFSKYPLDTPERQSIIDGIMATILYDMEKIHIAGAKNILLLGLIPLENLPVYHDLPSETKYLLENLVFEYNTRLIEILNRFKVNKSDLNASYFNTNELFKQLFDREQVEINARSHCNKQIDCGDYIWWDFLHPSSKTHAKIATAIYHYVESLNW
ncbi:hypothetical protein INT46_009462 [Mucor plumbeus]|uniref:Uncharacterized protein n=1 Tax=Mucor plumbeus TaxID=97098 RepID=A0A8H7UQF3_9FUNG|nr:hypothetical protein INT46_009462 [Mucor plumbeus]